MLVSRFFLALLLAAPFAPALAQSSPLFTLQDVPVSPVQVGLGGAAAFAPSESPYVVQFNPALLADAGARPGLRFSTSLAPDAFGNEDILIGSSAGSLSFRTGLAGYPLTVGLGGSYTELNLDAVQRIDAQGNLAGEYDTAERSSGGGLGIGWDGPVHVRIGGAAFYRESAETPRVISDRDALGRDNVTTLDLGTAVTYDVLGGPDEAGEAAISLRITGGYTRRNIVLQEDYFTRDAVSGTLEGAPPPEADVFGGSAAVALTRQVGRRFRFRVARADARADFTTGDNSGSDLGASVTLFETLVVRAGRSQRGTSRDVTSAGLGVQIDGLIRAIGTFAGNPRVASFGDRLTLRGDVARYDLGETFETDFAGFTLGWR